MSLEHPIAFGSASNHLATFLQEKQYSQIIAFCDNNTARDCLPLLDTISFDWTWAMPAGEPYKTITTCEQLWQQMIDHNVDRKALLVNIGGGVVTDLGGFVASCYKRGIDFVNIPTTLLAQVDASVGGKTGVDFADIKNSIGSFATAETVLIDSAFLKTLPHRQVNNGIAEILKHGFIADADHLDTLDKAVANGDWLEVTEQSIAIKKGVVLSDPYEKGLRKILNFGHTIGHAIESYSLQHDSDPLLHGEAIAMGMIAESQLSINYCGLPVTEHEELKARINQFFDFRKYPTTIIPELISLMQNDKKNAGSVIQMSLLKHIGQATFGIEVKASDIKELLEELFS